MTQRKEIFSFNSDVTVTFIFWYNVFIQIRLAFGYYGIKVLSLNKVKW